MGEIFDTTRPFPFNKLELTSPITRGGNYVIKMTVNESPVYLQPPKCYLKQGLIKAGKKMYVDLVFSNENEKFIHWLETLETTCQHKIFENRTKWFENDLDEHDIENYMTSPYKIYKSGKMYVIRTNVPTVMDKCNLKIYDEQEHEVDPEDLKENTDVITILEFKGIKCSVRSFQFDIEIKQMLVLAPKNLFDKCIIHRKPVEESIPEDVESLASIVPPKIHSVVKPDSDVEPPLVDVVEENARPDLEEPEVEKILTNLKNMKSNVDDITEVDLDLEVLDNDVVHLKNKNDVHYKMYKEAKQKAKEAKMIALSNYLEAKRIKATYFLNDTDSDESDLEDLEEIANE